MMFGLFAGVLIAFILDRGGGVALYFDCMSAPVWRRVMTSLFSWTRRRPSPLAPAALAPARHCQSS